MGIFEGAGVGAAHSGAPGRIGIEPVSGQGCRKGAARSGSPGRHGTCRQRPGPQQYAIEKVAALDRAIHAQTPVVGAGRACGVVWHDRSCRLGPRGNGGNKGGGEPLKGMGNGRALRQVSAAFRGVCRIGFLLPAPVNVATNPF
jgi:hypothetical protein